MPRVFPFPPRFRLSNTDEISQVFNFDCRASARHFLARARPSAFPFPRIAIMVPKKTASRAVQRNYMRRVIREKLRRTPAKVRSLDIVLNIKNAFNRGDYDLICRELDAIFTELQKCRAS